MCVLEVKNVSFSEKVLYALNEKMNDPQVFVRSQLHCGNRLLQKGFYEKFRKIFRETPVHESLF